MASKNQILIVDDEPQNLESLFNALISENYEIIAAPNGKIALELLDKYRPSAIIMDWDMPEMDGIDTIKEIRENINTNKIPVIISTGKLTSVKNLATALKSGANDYIRKPFDNVEIIARVQAMIRLNDEFKKNIELQKTFFEDKLKINQRILTTEKLKLVKHIEEKKLLLKELSVLKPHTTKEGRKILNKITSNIKANESHINWIEIETLFSKIHPSFNNKLLEEYPDITFNDRRLCALIKLNFSTQEISAILNKQNESVKKAKYRLKNKLELTSVKSLYNYIQSI